MEFTKRTRRVAILAAVLATTGIAIYGAGTRTVFAGNSTTKEDPKPSGTSKAAATNEHQHHAAPAKPAASPAMPPSGRGGQVMTIVGEVMDPACFLEAGPKSIGPGHFQCAVDCAKSGQTLAIFDRANDRIYFIAGELPGKNPNDPVMQYIHKLVDVTGTVYHRSGAYGIVIAKVELHRGPAPTAAKAAAK